MILPQSLVNLKYFLPYLQLITWTFMTTGPPEVQSSLKVIKKNLVIFIIFWEIYFMKPQKKWNNYQAVV